MGLQLPDHRFKSVSRLKKGLDSETNSVLDSVLFYKIFKGGVCHEKDVWQVVIVCVGDGDGI